jgi:hypothetical protein
LDQTIFRNVNTGHRNVEAALGETFCQGGPFEGNESQANVQVACKLVGIGDIVADQLAAAFR